MPEENERLADRNIVVFGQTGAGKSSLINMLAGESVADVSDDACGCTPSNGHYPILHGDVSSNSRYKYTFWDTAGLNEGQQGTVSSRSSIQNLLHLVSDHDVNLLIYCIRGRLVDIICANYDLFWRVICRRAVPVVLVITGLELEDDLDDWWGRNSKNLKKMEMEYEGHACIVTTKGRGGIYKDEYEVSAKRVWKLVEEHCRSKPWHMPPDWPSEARRLTGEYMESYSCGSRSGVRKVLDSVHHLSQNTVHNVIVFGKLGSGKSSLVNMISAKASQTSKAGSDFTSVKIGNVDFHIHAECLFRDDQVNWQAIQGLYTLIRKLESVSLLIYSAPQTLKKDSDAIWAIFAKIICGRKVPIIVDETQEPFRIFRTKPTWVVYFPESQSAEDARTNSKPELRELVKEHHRQRPWSMDEKDAWFATLYLFPRLDYSPQMEKLIAEETSENQDYRDNFKRSLLRAETESQGERIQPGLANLPPLSSDSLPQEVQLPPTTRNIPNSMEPVNLPPLSTERLQEEVQLAPLPPPKSTPIPNSMEPETPQQEESSPTPESINIPNSVEPETPQQEELSPPLIISNSMKPFMLGMVDVEIPKRWPPWKK